MKYFKSFLFLIVPMLVFLGCATFQSVVKSTFPYIANLIIPASSQVNTEQSVTGTASSFDQDISKNRDTSARVKEVWVASARLKSENPTGFNIGNFVYVKVYASKAAGADEVLVASRTDVTPDDGNTLELDINNQVYLDKLIHEPQIKIRLVYQLRNPIDVNAHLHLVLRISANPGK